MVSETLEAGSLVSLVARRHDVNANQLFKWRRELLPQEPPYGQNCSPRREFNRRASAPTTVRDRRAIYLKYAADDQR
jgi:transposase-like protein